MLGAAVTGFLALLLAVAGLLAPLYVAIAIAATFAAGCAYWKNSPFSLAYWRTRANMLQACWDIPAAIIYLIMVVEALPAIIPNVGGDPIHYHLAYAEDWARAGQLTVDPFLRFPFYASNFVMLFATFFTMHADAFINFLCWLTGLLTALGIYAFSRNVMDERHENNWSAAACVFLTVAVVASPVYWRWMDTAYMDVPIGAFAMFAILALYIGAEERNPAWLFAAAVLSGYLMGMKASFLLLIPIFALAIFATAKYLAASRKVVLAALALLLLASCPWYVRNFALAGDPSPPAFNLALYGHDGLEDKSEWAAIGADLFTTKTPESLFLLPVRAFKDAQTSMDFREYGVAALIMLLYLPGIWLLVRFGLGRKIEFGHALLIVMLCIFTAYWFGISTILRYGLLLYPTLAICCALCARPLAVRWPKVMPAVAVVAFLLIIPTPASRQWYWERYSVFYRYVAQVYTGDDAYLRKFDNGYIEEQFTASLMKQRNLQGVVYALGGDVEYFFRQDGIISAGDWGGPAGYFRLYRAVDAGRAAQFMRSLNVDAVLVDPRKVIGGLGVPLARQLTSSGYTAVTIPDSSYQLYVLQHAPRVAGVEK
jgi:hypothetical protein